MEGRRPDLVDQCQRRARTPGVVHGVADTGGRGPRTRIVPPSVSESWSHSEPPRPAGSRNTAMRQVDASVDEVGTGTGAGAQLILARSGGDSVGLRAVFTLAEKRMIQVGAHR